MADLKVGRKGRPINSALPQKGTVLEDAHRRVFAPPKTRDLCHPTELIPRVCLTENSVSQIKREPSYARFAGCHKIGNIGVSHRNLSRLRPHLRAIPLPATTPLSL